LVRFRCSKSAADELDHDRWTDAVIANVNSSGEAYFGGVTWRGRRAMRISVCNWRTSCTDISRAIASVEAALQVSSSADDQRGNALVASDSGH
jgi:hypothetical protein